MRAGESAAAVDAVVDEVAVVKAVAPMLRNMSGSGLCNSSRTRQGTAPLSRSALACIVAIQAKMVSGTSRATGDPMGMHTTKVAVGEGKFALEAQLYFNWEV